MRKLMMSTIALAGVTGASATEPWPSKIPCRTQESSNTNLMVATLGAVATPLAQGSFDPVTDQVTLKDGTVVKNYYRDTLGIKNYAPLDKSHYQLPPSGWCTREDGTLSKERTRQEITTVRIPKLIGLFLMGIDQNPEREIEFETHGIHLESLVLPLKHSRSRNITIETTCGGAASLHYLKCGISSVICSRP